MSRKEGHRAEEKVRIMKCENSISAGSLEVGEGWETIHRWTARNEAEGETGLLPQSQNRVYPPEMKRQAVQDYLAGGGSLREICKKYKDRKSVV